MFHVIAAQSTKFLVLGCIASFVAVSVQGQVVIRGTVRDSATQQPLPQTQVSVVGSGRQSLSDSTGHYAIAFAKTAAVHLAVIRLGFLPQSIDVTDITADTIQLDIALTQLPQALSTVSVEARASEVPLEYQYTHRYDKFFHDRANNSTRGTFYTRKQLVAYGSLARALRAVGVRVVEGRAGVIMDLSFPACPLGLGLSGGPKWYPTVIIDGVVVAEKPPIVRLNSISIKDVELIEVFPSAASSPADARGDGCGAVIIFTRDKVGG
jgi:hypothetical protein